MPGDYDIEYASPWAGANYFPVGTPGSNLQKFEEATWGELDRICREIPEAGIHYQETKIYGRKKDTGTAVGQWFQELVKEDAWFKKVVPNVGLHSHRCSLANSFQDSLPANAFQTMHFVTHVHWLINTLHIQSNNHSFASYPSLSSPQTAILAQHLHQSALTHPSTSLGYSVSARRTASQSREASSLTSQKLAATMHPAKQTLYLTAQASSHQS